jgi:hypothetical protein
MLLQLRAALITRKTIALGLLNKDKFYTFIRKILFFNQKVHFGLKTYGMQANEKSY